MSSITHLPAPVEHLTRTQLDDRVDEHGKCSGRPDDAVFFPNHAITPEDAQAACADCPVIAECLERTLRVEAIPFVQPHGIAGGKTPEERKALLRSRRRRSRAVQASSEQLAVAS